MTKAYMKIADQLLKDKLINEFKDWQLVKSSITTGIAVLVRNNIEIEIKYEESFFLKSIKIINESQKQVGNGELMDIYLSLVEKEEKK